MHVALILPADEVLAREVRLAKGFVARLVVGVPRLALLGRELAGRDELRGRVQCHRLRDRHVLVALGVAAAGVVVEQRLAARDTCGRLSWPRCRSAGSHSRCGALCWHISRNGFDLSRFFSQSSERSVMMSVA